MNNSYKVDENLYRALKPSTPMMLFIKNDGTVSSAAYKDPKGCSVDRGNYRSDSIVKNDMLKRLCGKIAKFKVSNCFDMNILLKYLPTEKDIYHTEIYRNQNEKLLTKSQAKYLAKNSIII